MIMHRPLPSCPDLEWSSLENEMDNFQYKIKSFNKLFYIAVQRVHKFLSWMWPGKLDYVDNPDFDQTMLFDQPSQTRQ